jgi:hypothetical protein
LKSSVRDFQVALATLLPLWLVPTFWPRDKLLGVVTPSKLQAFWWNRQGLDGSLESASAETVLKRAGWARSVGGANPYLTLLSRAGIRKAAAESAVGVRTIH